MILVSIPLSFPSLGIAWVEAAEGETVPTMVVVGRGDVRRIEVQVVGVGRRASRTRPTVAAVADVVYLTIINIDVPAPDIS